METKGCNINKVKQDDWLHKLQRQMPTVAFILSMIIGMGGLIMFGVLIFDSV